MDRQGPPNRPRYQLTRGLTRTRHEKDAMTSRCLDRKRKYDLANALSWPVLPVLYTGRLFLTFGGTGRTDR